MTPAAEKDIRSALRQLRGCRTAVAHAFIELSLSGYHGCAGVVRGWQMGLRRSEKKLLALLGADRPVPRRRVRLKYRNGDAKGVF